MHQYTLRVGSSLLAAHPGKKGEMRLRRQETGSGAQAPRRDQLTGFRQIGEDLGVKDGVLDPI